MKSKVLLATAAATIAGFLAGWLIFGIGLNDWMMHNSINYEGLYKEMPDLLMVFLAHIPLGLMLAYVMDRMSVASAKGGLVAGAIICGLVYLSTDLFMYSMMNLWETPMVILVDLIANAAWGAIIGAVIGMVLGRGQAAAA